MITCRELVDFILSYLENELSPREKLEFERHLAVCPACVEYLKSYKATVRLEKDAYHVCDEPAHADALPEDLVKAILASRRKKP